MNSTASINLMRENEQLQREADKLRQRLEAAEETLRAIHAGEVDAVVVAEPNDRVYLLETADRPYRVLVEQMPLGALTLTSDGVILYCNQHFADLVQRLPRSVLGKLIHQFVSP